MKEKASAVTAVPDKGDKVRALYATIGVKLTSGAQNVLQALIWHSNAKTGRCDPSVSRLANETGQSERNVYRAIKELEEARLIVRIRHAGSAFCNAYAVQWNELRDRYQKWLSDNGLAATTPDTDVAPPMTRMSQTPDIHGTQTVEKPEKEIREEIRSSSSSSLKRDDASQLGIQREYGGEALPPLNFLAKSKAPSSKSVAREKAHQHFDEDLRNHLPADAYEEVLDRIDHATVDKAIAAEIAKPGTQAGLQTALEALHDKLHTVACDVPIASALNDFPELPKFLRRTRM